jgi:hypothetical protein
MTVDGVICGFQGIPGSSPRNGRPTPLALSLREVKISNDGHRLDEGRRLDCDPEGHWRQRRPNLARDHAASSQDAGGHTSMDGMLPKPSDSMRCPRPLTSARLPLRNHNDTRTSASHELARDDRTGERGTERRQLYVASYKPDDPGRGYRQLDLAGSPFGHGYEFTGSVTASP